MDGHNGPPNTTPQVLALGATWGGWDRDGIWVSQAAYAGPGSGLLQWKAEVSLSCKSCLMRNPWMAESCHATKWLSHYTYPLCDSCPWRESTGQQFLSNYLEKARVAPFRFGGSVGCDLEREQQNLSRREEA